MRSRETTSPVGGPPDPSREIVRSFRLAEISESEMEALLAYVGDPDDDGCLAADAIERFDEGGPETWPADVGTAPRHPR